MSDSHPSPDDLRHLAAGEFTDPAAQRAVAGHLLSRCAVCLAIVEATTTRSSAAPPTPPPLPTDRSFSRGTLARTGAARTALQSDAGVTIALWLVVGALAPAGRRSLVESDPRFHQWPFAHRLPRHRRRSRPTRPAEASSLCRLALVIADRLLADRHPASLRQDLRARAWGLRGEALRRSGRLTPRPPRLRAMPGWPPTTAAATTA